MHAEAEGPAWALVWIFLREDQAESWQRHHKMNRNPKFWEGCWARGLKTAPLYSPCLMKSAPCLTHGSCLLGPRTPPLKVTGATRSRRSRSREGRTCPTAAGPRSSVGRGSPRYMGGLRGLGVGCLIGVLIRRGSDRALTGNPLARACFPKRLLRSQLSCQLGQLAFYGKAARTPWQAPMNSQSSGLGLAILNEKPGARKTFLPCNSACCIRSLVGDERAYQRGGADAFRF